MNYHFTTTKAHFELAGAKVLEVFTDEAMDTQSTHPFRGDMDMKKLKEAIQHSRGEQDPIRPHGSQHQLIGGQPFSLGNLREVKKVAAAARHSLGLRWQPDLRKRLFHQGARSSLRGYDHRARSSRK